MEQSWNEINKDKLAEKTGQKQLKHAAGDFIFLSGFNRINVGSKARCNSFAPLYVGAGGYPSALAYKKPWRIISGPSQSGLEGIWGDVL